MAVLVISYSREDQPQVREIVTLLRAALREIERAVYWDGDFEPGDLWFEQMQKAIDAAPQVFVFWCDHASGSIEVGRELDYAIQRRKRVVPVLLDSTPLPPSLSPIHGIDLRRAVQHTMTDPSPPLQEFPVNRVRAIVSRAIAMVRELFAPKPETMACPPPTPSLIRPDLELEVVRAFRAKLSSHTGF